MEYQIFSTTGASQITTVVNSKSKMLYAIRLAMQYSTRFDVGTLVFVAVPICAIRNTGLQMLTLFTEVNWNGLVAFSVFC